MDLLCDQANLSLDHTAQKERSELAHRGKLGKRRRPSRVCLKASLIVSPPAEDDETRWKIGKKLKNEEKKCVGKNPEDCQTNVEDDKAAIIKHGPKGTIIEIGTRKEVELSTVNPSENDDSYSGPVIKGAILKIPESISIEKNSLNVMENGVHSSSDDEADFLAEDGSSRRWKSLPSLCQDDKTMKTEEKDDAPWVHQVKLRHVEDPESPNRRGCSMLFFGPLPKTLPAPIDGINGSVTPPDNDSQLPQNQHKNETTFRPVRARPVSMCEHVQIQTWDRRHLTANSKINGERKRDSKFRRSDPTRSSKIWQDIPQIIHASINDESHPEAKETVNESKSKKTWKTETLENGVHRSKSLNGIDKDDRQPEWIEISKKVTSKNIDWENLPTAKKCSRGKSLQNELRMAWKKLGNQLNSEPPKERKDEEKEEIVLNEDDLPVIRNVLTKQDHSKVPSKMFSHREKLDANANFRCQKKVVPVHDHEAPKLNSVAQNSLGNQDVSWIKEAEKRRQKYMDWQSQVANEENSKEEEEKRKAEEKRDDAIQICENIGKTMVEAEKKREENSEESSPFPVKLRRVRCAKPEECFHQVKCPFPSFRDAHEARSPVSLLHPPLLSSPSKAGSEENESVVQNGLESEYQSALKQSTCESFSVQLSDFEGDNFYVVINEQGDESFTQIKPENEDDFKENLISRFKREDAKLEEVIKTDKDAALTKETILNGNQYDSYKEDSGNCTNSAKSSDIQADEECFEAVLDDKCEVRNGILNDVKGREELKNTFKENGFATKTRNGIQETYENLTINGISAIPIYPGKTKRNKKAETLEEKAARMTNDICGVLSSLGRYKTPVEKQCLQRDILKSLTCPNIRQSKERPSRTLTLVTCDGDGLVASSVQGRLSELSSVGVQTNCDDVEQEVFEEKKSPKKVQTRIKKKTVKIIIHECDDDEEKQEVVEEIVEQILEPRQQKGRLVRKEPTISRTVEETEDGHKYLATTVTDGCTFCVDDSA